MDKYKCIYIDPPWQVKAGRPFSGYKVVDGIQVFNNQESKSRSLAYPTLSLDEICALPVAELADQDAHLYLWVINKYMPDIRQVLEAWGFVFSTCITWVKSPMGGGLGGAFGISTEYLIYARRGKLKAKRRHKSTWYHIKRPYKNGKPNHSAKPPFFRQLIEETSPGPRLEMFARENNPGWDVFGNEVENSINLPRSPSPSLIL